MSTNTKHSKQREQLINLSLSVALARQRAVSEIEVRELVEEAGYASDFSANEIAELATTINERFASAEY